MTQRIGKKWYCMPSAVALVIAISAVAPLKVMADEEDHGQEHGEEAVEIEIIMDEQFFQQVGQGENETVTINADELISIEFYNDGFEKHEIMFGRGGFMMEEGESHGYMENLFDGVMVVMRGESDGNEFEVMAGDLLEITLDAEAALTIEFIVPESKAGTWELGCFLKDHYEKGMHSSLVVKH